ncbi:MAG TPA: ABC transporter permease, partial [Polyangia bacterium]
LLTLAGIIIGSGSIVLITGLLQSSGDLMLRANQEANEADLIRVGMQPAPRAQAERTQRPLSRGDADELRASPSLKGASVVSESVRPARASWRQKQKRVSVVGAEPVALSLYRLTLQQGRFLSDADVRERRRVCVVGQEVWRELLEAPPSTDTISLTLDGQTWAVVGVLAHKPVMNSLPDDTSAWNRKVVVPATSFDAVYAPRHEATQLFVRVGHMRDLEGQLAAACDIVRALLLRRHLGVENFKVAGRGGAVAKQATLIALIVRMLIVGSSLLSLFVGGINVMNIMMVTVTERTREIGVRRAIGASPRQVLGLFLLEATLLAGLGGLGGVAGGIAVSWLFALVFKATFGFWQMHVVGWAVEAGLLLSLLTGVVFGMLPARRAARLDPVEALRYE